MDSYYIIVGLGNPGSKYEGTRHNVGFKVIDELAVRFKIDRPVRFGKSMIGKGVIAGEKVILVKPMRKKGSAGGHNGLKNIILHLGDDEFTRIRIGVGGKAAPGADLVNHVLGHFAGEDKEIVEEAFVKAADAVVCALEEGPDKAMNRFNTRKQKKPKKQKETADAPQEAPEKENNADVNSSSEGI